MVYLPAVIAKYAVEKERTAFEMHAFLSTLVSGNDCALAKMVYGGRTERTWCSSNNSAKGGPQIGPGSECGAGICAVGTQTTLFLCGTGTGKSGGTTTSAGSAESCKCVPPIDDTSLDGVRNIPQSGAERASKEISDERKTLNDYDISALCGFCGVSDPGQCPAIYPMFKTSKSTDDARANIMKGMEMFAKEEGIEIDRSVFLGEEVIKDIMKVRPNPFGTVGTAETSDRGVSNLVLLPRRNEEIEKMMLQERAAEESKATRTLRDAEKLAKNNTRAITPSS
jgi:hypothetical protein